MKQLRKTRQTLDVTIGCAAGEDGLGVAYARLTEGGEPVRVAFTARPLSGCERREVTYAALEALAATFRRRGFGHITFRVADAKTAAELAGERPVHPALALHYMTLRCAFNALGTVEILAKAPEADDLEARARAEVTFHIAA